MAVKIGRYEVLGEIARGGFGVVLRARDPSLNREVAIKVLLAGAGAGDLQRKRFEREVKALARLRHANIVPLHEAGFAREGPFVVMDLVDGESLEARLEREGPLPLRDALRLMEAVARAIGHAHEQGVLHRDLKPANVLIDRAGTPLVTDFGLAREVDPRLSMSALSRSGASLGTPGFWPPEQAYGQLDRIGPASDVYGLGATLYALLTGEPPYNAESVIEVLGLMGSPPTPPSEVRPEVPPAVDALVLRAMAHEPADRHASADAFAAALADARRRLGAAAGPRPRGVALVVGAAAALGVALAAGAFVVLRAATGGAPDARPRVVVTPTEAPPPAATEAPPQATEPPAPPEAPDPLAEALVALARDGSPDEKVRAARDAVARADEALVARPDHVDALLLRARARAVLQDMTGAAQDASVALTLAPDRVDALIIRALLRREQEDPDGVLEDVQRVLDASTDVPPELRAQAFAQRAWARARRDQTVGALEDYTEAIGLTPRADWLVEVGSLSLQLGHVEAAENDFTSALALEPDNVVALVNRAAVHMRKADLDAALADADHAVEVLPDNARVLLRRSEVHEARSDWPPALADAERALALDPSLWEAWQRRGAIRSKQGDTAGAIADFREALLREPGRADLLRSLGILLLRSRDLVGAREALDAAVRADPSNVDAYMTRAELHEERGDLDASLADYAAVIERAPDRWDAYYNRGILRGRLRDDAGARADYDRALALNEGEYRLWLNRGDLRRRTGDLEGALSDLERAAGPGADDPNVDLALGLALHEAKDYERADAALTRYLEREPDNARIWAERAMVREKRADPAAALADYRRAQTLSEPGGADRVHAFVTQRIAALQVVVEGQGGQ